MAITDDSQYLVIWFYECASPNAPASECRIKQVWVCCDRLRPHLLPLSPGILCIY